MAGLLGTKRSGAVSEGRPQRTSAHFRLLTQCKPLTLGSVALARAPHGARQVAKAPRPASDRRGWASSPAGFMLATNAQERRAEPTETTAGSQGYSRNGQKGLFPAVELQQGPMMLTPTRQRGDTGRRAFDAEVVCLKLFLSDVSISKQTNNDKTHTSSVTCSFPDKNRLFISVGFPAAPPTFPLCVMDASPGVGWRPACNVPPAALLKCGREDGPGL